MAEARAPDRGHHCFASRVPLHIDDLDGQRLDDEGPFAEPARVVHVGTESANDVEDQYLDVIGKRWQKLASAFVRLRLHPQRPKVSPGPRASNYPLDEQL